PSKLSGSATAPLALSRQRYPALPALTSVPVAACTTDSNGPAMNAATRIERRAAIAHARERSIGKTSRHHLVRRPRTGRRPALYPAPLSGHAHSEGRRPFPALARDESRSP